jgi:hypothetical protein
MPAVIRLLPRLIVTSLTANVNTQSLGLPLLSHVTPDRSDW